MVDRLCQGLVHSESEALLDVLLLCVACDSADYWLLFNSVSKLIVVELSDLLSALEAVHEWHVAVHQDEAILTILPLFLLFNVISDDLKGLLSVKCVLH